MSDPGPTTPSNDPSEQHGVPADPADSVPPAPAAHLQPTQESAHQPPTSELPYQPSAMAQGAPLPVPSPPSYDPAAMAQQYSGPPVSGPYGYPMPVSAYPMAPPPRRGRAGTIVLAVLATLFLAAGAVLGTLFFQKDKEGQQLTAQVATLTTDNAAQKKQLDTAQRQLTDAKNDLDDTEDELTEITTHKQVLGDCINALTDYWEAVFVANGRVNDDVRAKEGVVDVTCNEANKYLAVAR